MTIRAAYEEAALELGPAISRLSGEDAKAVLRNLVAAAAAHRDEQTSQSFFHHVRVHARLPAPERGTP